MPLETIDNVIFFQYPKTHLLISITIIPVAIAIHRITARTAAMMIPTDISGGASIFFSPVKTTRKLGLFSLLKSCLLRTSDTCTGTVLWKKIWYSQCNFNRTCISNTMDHFFRKRNRNKMRGRLYMCNVLIAK